MNSIIVKKKWNLADLEDALKLAALPGHELRMPHSLSYSGAFGMEVFSLQLLATWLRTNARHGKKSSATIFVKDNLPKSFDELSSSLLGIATLVMPDELRFSEGSELVDEGASLELASNRIDHIQRQKFSNAFKGPYVAIPSFRTNRFQFSELASPFYRKGAESMKDDGFSQLVPASGYRGMVKSILESILTTGEQKNFVDTQFRDLLSSLLYELFANTHLHARRDLSGNLISKNLRAVIFKTATFTGSRIQDFVKPSDNSAASPEMAKFFLHWTGTDGLSRLKFLDVSIVDFGVGFAKRWTGNENLSIDDEVAAIVACFQGGGSSDPNPGAGWGLDKVLHSLSAQKGWLRLRTGNCVVEKSFVVGTNATEITKKDVVVKSSFAEGSALNLLLPLTDNIQNV